MIMSKGLIIGGAIVSLIATAIGTTCSVVTAVDQVKNGDKRAAIAGDACGRQLAGQAISQEVITDPKTGKKFKRGLLGSLIEVTNEQ